MSEIQTREISKLKFLDEAHFVSHQLTNCKVLGLVNKRVWLKQNTLNQASGTLTILTSVVGDPVVLTYSEATTNQWAFLDFVLSCCLNGDLMNGDYLIVDNAAIHHGSDSHELLELILEFFGVQLIYLPAYSPELNPCELVFNVVKKHIRYHRDRFSPIFEEVLKAVATITESMMKAFYYHCIFPKVVLPDMQ
ncbi:MAG TPA: transposase [Candidatus Dojkabacteria bacterium]|nr:transposase [Candidatus Dojkabacteria bacterium]